MSSVMKLRVHISRLAQLFRCRYGGGMAKEPESTFAAAESGSVLVEFAVLVPAFFLILFGIIQYGMIFTLQNNMMNAAREAVREAAVQGKTPAQALDKACTYMKSNGQMTGQTLNLTFTDSCNAAPNVTMFISADMQQASVVNYLTMFTGHNLTASVTMRKELACTVAGSVTTATCTMKNP